MCTTSANTRESNIDSPLVFPTIAESEKMLQSLSFLYLREEAGSLEFRDGLPIQPSLHYRSLRSSPYYFPASTWSSSPTLTL